MIENEYKWQISLIQERYRQLKLSFEQAEKVYVFEKENDLRSKEYYFSAWEEFDYMLDNFSKILDGIQLKKYKKWHRGKIKKHEQFLIDTDKEKVNYIAYYNEVISYYEQQYIPYLLKEKFLMAHIKLSDQKEKIIYLKSEYKKYLDSERVGRISEHYRHYRLLKPNELVVTLLRHKLLHIIPSYWYFKSKMDTPTESIAKFLLHEFSYLPGKYADFLKTKEDEIVIFKQELRKKYLDRPDRGYSLVLNIDEQAKKENQIMQMILFDIDQYK